MFIKKISIILIVLSIFSCDNEAEITIGNYVEEVNTIFKVNFDNETWIADHVTTTIIEGVTRITAFRNNDQEKIILNIHSDQVGSYNIINNEVDTLYQDVTDQDGVYYSNESVGIIDLDVVNTENQTLIGKFFFKGRRLVQQFNDDGTPILDTSGNTVFTTEFKDFTYGVFENINYSTVPDDDVPTGDADFYAKLNGLEFVEETLTAIKENGVITITANRDGTNESIVLIMPDNIEIGSNYTLTNVSVDPTVDNIATYSNTVTVQNYGAANGTNINDVGLPVINIITHNLVLQKIRGTFEFTAFEAGGSGKVQVTQGAFSVVYTEI